MGTDLELVKNCSALKTELRFNQLLKTDTHYGREQGIVRKQAKLNHMLAYQPVFSVDRLRLSVMVLSCVRVF